MPQMETEHRSIWRATAVGDVHEPLHGDVEADVAVVGGGITGLTCAVLLAEAGADVVLVEARRVGAGTTGGTTGKVTSQHGLIYQDLVDQHGEEVAAGYAGANQEAVGMIRDLVDRYGIDADLDAADAYVYTEDPDELARMERETEIAQRLGLPASWSASTDLPFDVVGAVRFDDQAQLHAVKFLHGLARALTDLGGRLHEDTRAIGIERPPGQRLVRTTRGDIRVSHVVLATLIPIVDRGFEFARAEPSMTYGIASPAADAVPRGMYISAEQPTRSIRHYHAEDGAFVIVVGDSHRTGGERETRRHHDLLDMFARDRLGAGTPRFRWAAQDFVPVDLLPMIGAAALAPQVHVATGYNKWGLTNGTVAAAIIADAVGGRDNPYAEMLSTRRVTVTASAKRFLAHNLDVAKRFVGDRISPDGRALDDIPPGGGGVVLTDGQYKAVSRANDGTVTVRSAVCPHLGCIVQWNEAEDTWDCPCHGSRYDVNGDVLSGPTTSPLEEA